MPRESNYPLLRHLQTEADRQYEVHCGRCNWWGMIDQMKPIYKPNPLQLGDVIPELGCPICSSDQWLEYKER